MRKKRACITFLGNINYDTRCRNLYHSLSGQGYEVDFIGFDWQSSTFTPQRGKVSVYRLSKRFLSLWFYFKFAVILKWRLFTKKYDIYLAEDVYTLPFCAFTAKVTGGRLFYDSREIFAHLAGLKDKAIIQKLLARLESAFIHSADSVLVTGRMDGEYLEKTYSIRNWLLLRNLPLYRRVEQPVDLRRKYDIPEDALLLVYQGVLLRGRGIRPAIEAMASVPGVWLVIYGDGDMAERFKRYALEIGLTDRVIFAGKLTQEELLSHTAGADAGIALIENLSLSYYYALPNKLFEYIMTGVPPLVSNLPQMKEIVEQYEVGAVLDMKEQQEIQSAFIRLKNNPDLLKRYRENCLKAAEELNWEREVETFLGALEQGG